MNRYALRDDHWDRIKDLLPGKPGDVGVAADDNRRLVEAVLYRYRTGIPWRDLPERLGDWKNTHERFSRGANKGDLPQRRRSRRRWWLGRVSETLRGKRSRGFKAAIITPIAASMRISAHRKRLPAYWLSRPDIYRGAFWSRLQAMARSSVLFKPRGSRSSHPISSIMV